MSTATIPSHQVEWAILAEGASNDHRGLLSITRVIRVLGVPKFPHNQTAVVVFAVSGMPHSQFSYGFQLVRPDLTGSKVLPAIHRQSIGQHGVSVMIQELPLPVSGPGLYQIGVFLNDGSTPAAVARVHFVLDAPVPASTTHH